MSACRRPTHAQIRRINLDGSGAEIVARGTRQIVGMDWHPVLKQLYFTENQRDWLSEDLPEDKLNRLTHLGKDNFGFPHCGGGNVLDPQFGWGHSCDEFTPPVARLGPHSAPLGMRFYTGAMFPKEYHNAIFIARHGSWNRSKKFGGDVVVVKLNPDGTVKSVEPFITVSRKQQVYRPAGRYRAHERRVDADLGRLERRGVPPDLRPAAHQHAPLTGSEAWDVPVEPARLWSG